MRVLPFRRTPRLSGVALVLAGCLEGSVPQSPACAQYVRCIAAIDAITAQETDLDRYEVGGACWSGSKIGELCTTSCERALERISERDPAAPAECAP